MRSGCDGQMEETKQDDEDILCWRPGQPHRVGCDDSDWADQHRRYMGTSEAVPIVHVTKCINTVGASDFQEFACLHPWVLSKGLRIFPIPKKWRLLGACIENDLYH